MNCPVRSIDLMIADRQGIEIDYCPKCRGIWLDRGELDKIMERSAMAMPHNDEGEYREHRAYQTRPTCRQHRQPHGHQSNKRKSLLQEIFDFD